MVAILVFRRLESPADLALAGRRLGRVRHPQESWFGLWNLTAAEDDALVAVAATRQRSARSVEVRAIKSVPGYDVPARLLRELADVCRARGVEWLVANQGGTEPEVLRRAGFRSGGEGWMLLL